MRISILALAAIAGFLGGAAASRWQNLTTVHAQDLNLASKILRSKTFVLLDRDGRTRGEWTIAANGQPVIRMFKADGRLLWETKIPGGQLIHAH